MMDSVTHYHWWLLLIEEFRLKHLLETPLEEEPTAFGDTGGLPREMMAFQASPAIQAENVSIINVGGNLTSMGAVGSSFQEKANSIGAQDVLQMLSLLHAQIERESQMSQEVRAEVLRLLEELKELTISPEPHHKSMVKEILSRLKGLVSEGLWLYLSAMLKQYLRIP